MELKIKQEYINLVPKMSMEEYEALKEDIQEHGLYNPLIVNSEGTILDGHTRLQILNELGLQIPEPIIHASNNELEEKQFVVSINLKRRHLSDFNKALMGMELLKIESQLAHGRMVKGTLASNDASGKASEKVAQQIGLSSATFERAKAVIDSKETALIDKVANGDCTINGAYKLVRESEQAIEMMESLNPAIKEKIRDQIYPMLFNADMDLKQVDAIIRDAEGSPVILKKVEYPYSRFVNEGEASKWAANAGGRLLGIRKVWVMEIDPKYYKESKE